MLRSADRFARRFVTNDDAAVSWFVGNKEALARWKLYGAIF